MFGPTDDLSIRFDELNGLAFHRGWPGTFHAHPARYREVLRVEKLEARIDGALRTSAIRATVRLDAHPDDRRTWVRIEACFQTGSYRISYFDADGRMTDSTGGNVAHHKIYLERRDAREAMTTGYDLTVLSCLIRILRVTDGPVDAERLEAMRKAMRGEVPKEAWTRDMPRFKNGFVLEL